ncbi:MAG: hypothetical protein P0Y64_06675 [Candidatus Sphingomonas colombiensis]|nr:hypothetical protein [Sphingomonas sp.]WEK44474.1 MAG: hypothetical protein P0Y64_06675 [Sphingomonas sp.]
MPGEPPPSRYRVVERGRRLEVIDTYKGGRAATATPPIMASGGVARSLAPTAVASVTRPAKPPIGSLLATSPAANVPFVTMRLYDSKGPRTVRLDDRALIMVARVRLVALLLAMTWFLAALWQPLVAVLPLFLFARNGLGSAIRRRITNWLDRYPPA